MNNFFKIYSATPSKNETGYVSHQVEISSVQENYDYTLSNSYLKTYFEKKIDYEVIFPVFELVRGAKLTDLMNFSGGGSYSCMIISLRLLVILEKYKIDGYQTFKIKIKTKDGLKDFYFFFMSAPECESKYIDWDKTIFRIKPFVGTETLEDNLKFKNFEEYFELHKEIFRVIKNKREVAVSDLLLKRELIDKDMFKFNFISSGFFISERLKLEIEKQGITGISFRDADGLREPSYSPEMD